jgi:Ser/Thr protein kinase RdoA (MazF antagonist)
MAELTTTAWNASRLLAGARMGDALPAAAPALDPEAGLRDARARFGVPASWVLRDRLRGVTDVLAVEVCDGPELVAVLKLARTAAGDRSLLLQQEALERLAGAAQLGRWRALLPDVLAHGIVGDRRYSIERVVPGTVGSALSRPLGATDALLVAGRAVSEFHAATGRAEVLSPTDVDGWLDPVLSMLLAEVPMLLRPRRRHVLVERLGDRVRSGVVGRAVWVGSTHGDYVPGNIFFGRTGGITGIIDWDRSTERDVALIDPMTLLLADRSRAWRTPLGEVVGGLCCGAPLTEREKALLDVHRAACPADPIAPDVLALLAWLRHVGNNLSKSARYRSHPVWVHRNVEAVLKVADGTTA